MQPISQCKDFTLTAHCAAVYANDKLWVHGGVKKRDALKPCNDLLSYDPHSDKWDSVSQLGADAVGNGDKSPYLSHHAAFVLENRYIHYVGGWTGKKRTGDVQIFDARNETWLNHCETYDFPTGAGLSSHTVTPLIGSNGVIVVGRLGGLRTQRQTSSVMLLEQWGDMKYKYTDLQIDVSSRSGHTATVIPASVSANMSRDSNDSTLLLTGGRDGRSGSDVEEICIQNYEAFEWSYDVLTNDDREHYYDYYSTFVDEKLIPVTAHNVKSRKDHCAVLINDRAVLLFGGEYFTQASRPEPLGGSESSLIYTKTQWYRFRDENLHNFPKLTGHKTVPISDRFFCLGGFGENWTLNNTLYELRL